MSIEGDAWLEAICKLHQAKRELREANAEIARHHKDFEKISALLENFFSDPNMEFHVDTSPYKVLKQIRNIVG